MDRQIVYPGGVPLDTDLLNAGRNTKKGLGRLAFLLFGEVSAAQGFTIALSSTDMTATIGEGTILATGPIDQTAIGGLGGGLDAVTDTVVNQYDSWANQTVTLLAGATTTIWAVCSETDGDETVLPFYNSENPAQTLAGSANDGADLPTQRQARVQIVASTTEPEVPAGSVVVALYSIVVPTTATSLAGLTATPQSAFYPTIPELMRGRFLSEEVITVSAGYTPSRWAKTLRVRMVGGGGAGGGAVGQAEDKQQVSCGGCGGSGGYMEFLVDVSKVSWPQQLTIGARGIGASGGQGSGGGNTTFGTLARCDGGVAGGTIAAVPGVGGWGGQSEGGGFSVLDENAVQPILGFLGENGQSPFIVTNFTYNGTTLVPTSGVPIPLIGPASPLGTGGANGTNTSSVPLVAEGAYARGSYGAAGGGCGRTGAGGMRGGDGAPGVSNIQVWY